ncbi:putative Potassium transport protein [Seiridium cardinale]
MKSPLKLNFITLHYAWILLTGLLALVAMCPEGNVAAIDAYFFGASASTESGLNTVDVKDLKTYQQLYIYFVPIFTNLGFINIIVVIVRLYRFEQRIRRHASSASQCDAPSDRVEDVEKAAKPTDLAIETATSEVQDPQPTPDRTEQPPATRITFAPDLAAPSSDDKALHIPSPRERDSGHPVVERAMPKDDGDDDDDAIRPVAHSSTMAPGFRRVPTGTSHRISHTTTIERAVTNMFVLGPNRSHDRTLSTGGTASTPKAFRRLPMLSKQATVGRNSQFGNLTARDRELLGGIEYRSLKLLLKIVSTYFFGLHFLGAICLLPWIHRANSKYTDYLDSIGQDKSWWAFYSAQTMVDNLGFTLTPDSMISFRDATWPLLVMSFLAFAGNTLYPVFLRLIIWIMSKLTSERSSLQEPLQFLLDHPRRCYTLLFPSKPTWVPLGIIAALNFIDILLIIVLDLSNPAVNDLSLGPRILSAIFQAASTRHTGTATLNLAKVNPAVQFSLVVMMYIAVFPISISIRASNTYEERCLGLYRTEQSLDEIHGRSYVMNHVKNQLNFDLWYIFLGTFCICISESTRIADNNQPEFSVFSTLFEVVSAYGNVGLSLGHPAVNTSLSGQFTTFSKLVICAMMIRGRHRGLPYALDRAIMLPGDNSADDDITDQYKQD